MGRTFKSKHSRAMDAREECKAIIKSLFAERARKGLPNDDVKDMSQIVQRGGFADDGWFQLRSKLKFMLNAPIPAQGAPSYHGNWEAAMQYVRSMVCDPAQFRKLEGNASYDDKRALEGLKNEFDAAKRSGKKVEKRPEDWLRAKDLVDRAKTGKRLQPQRSAFYQEPKAEPAHNGSWKPEEKPASQNRDAPMSENDCLMAACKELLQNQGSCNITASERDSLCMYQQWETNGWMNGADRKDLRGIIEQIHKRNGNGSLVQKKEDSLIDRCNALEKSGRLMMDDDFESKKARIIGRIDKIINNLGMVAEKESAELACYKQMVPGITPPELELLENIWGRADAIARQYGIL